MKKSAIIKILFIFFRDFCRFPSIVYSILPIPAKCLTFLTCQFPSNSRTLPEQSAVAIRDSRIATSIFSNYQFETTKISCELPHHLAIALPVGMPIFWAVTHELCILISYLSRGEKTSNPPTNLLDSPSGFAQKSVRLYYDWPPRCTPKGLLYRRYSDQKRILYSLTQHYPLVALLSRRRDWLMSSDALATVHIHLPLCGLTQTCPLPTNFSLVIPIRTVACMGLSTQSASKVGCNVRYDDFARMANGC